MEAAMKEDKIDKDDYSISPESYYQKSGDIIYIQPNNKFNFFCTLCQKENCKDLENLQNHFERCSKNHLETINESIISKSENLENVEIVVIKQEPYQVLDDNIKCGEVYYLKSGKLIYLLCTLCRSKTFTMFEEFSIHSMTHLQNHTLEGETVNIKTESPIEIEGNLADGFISLNDCTNDEKVICHLCNEIFQKNCSLISNENSQMIYTCDSCSFAHSNNPQITESPSVNSAENNRNFTKETAFKCNVCNQYFNYNRTLKEHMRIHTGERPFKCELCTKTFRFGNNYKAHLETHNAKQPYKCDYCDKTFRFRGNFNVHMVIHATKNMYKCNICDTSLKTKEELEEHSRKHTKENPYKCNLCNQSFRNINSLKEHIRKHTGEKSYKCQFCDKTFSLRKMNAHLIMHSNESSDSRNPQYIEKPVNFGCEICNKIFPSPSSLKIHFRKHSGERPYECEICSKCFTTSGSLKGHIQTHTNEKPFKCHLCIKTFSRNQSLQRHIRNHSKDDNPRNLKENPYKCDVCNKSYPHKMTLVEHKRIHTGERPYKCDFCSKTFRCSSNFKVHIQTHTADKPFKCDFCEKCFRSRSNVNAHMEIHIQKNEQVNRI